MRKLLHLVFAVWKTDRPFDEQHFPWEPPSDTPMSTPAAAAATTTPTNNKAVGHKRDVPAEKVVTTAASSVESVPTPVKAAATAPTPRPPVDFAFLREQVTLEQVLRHLGFFDQLRGRGPQRRGACPVHGQATDRQRTLSVHLAKNVFHCFDASCAAQGNVLDLWAAVRHLPLYDAVLDLAATFHLPRNREEAPV